MFSDFSPQMFPHLTVKNVFNSALINGDEIGRDFEMSKKKNNFALTDPDVEVTLDTLQGPARLSSLHF